MTQAEIEQSYWRQQADRQRAQIETQAALERARAEIEAGIPQDSESSVPWQKGKWGSQAGSGGWLDRIF